MLSATVSFLSVRELVTASSLVIAAAYGASTTAATPPADGDECGGPIAGAAIGTFCATLILIGLIYLFYRRHGRPKRGGKSKSCTTLTSVGVNDDRGRYAYDNPYFDDTEVANTNDGILQRINGDPILRGDSSAANNSVADGGKITNTAALHISSENNKLSPGAKAAKKMKTSKNNLLNALTTAKLGRHHKALDDSCIHLEPEKLSVPLRGIDFTGLGFNVCGNMRDGIFIKDVLHRGPAMESGKIKAGDRILSLTVSFTNMVYEDALTILSYASPYDVQLEVQKMSEMSSGGGGGGGTGSHGTMGHQKKGSNSSNVSTGHAAGRERLYHPLYRSQSFGDLSKIGKDDMATKRSSSIGGAGVGVKVPKKEPFTKTVQSLNEEGAVDFEFVNHTNNNNKTATALNLTSADCSSLSSIEAMNAADIPKTSRFRVQKVIENEGGGGGGAGENQQLSKEVRVSSVEDAVNKQPRDEDNVSSSSSSRFSGADFETVDLNDVTHSSVKAHIPVPAKRTSTGGGGKRKAPLPPGESQHSDNEDDYEDINLGEGSNTLQVSPDIHQVPDWVSHQPMVGETADSVAIQTNFSSDNESLSSDDEEKSASKPRNKFLDIGGGGNAERRASSLGDLTSVEESNKKNFPLERSVSMDFNHAELVHGKLATQQQHVDQSGATKLNENGTVMGGGSSDDDLVRVNPLKNYFGATENLYLGGGDNSLNGHSKYLKSWDQVESLADDDDEDEIDTNEVMNARDSDMKKWKGLDLSIPPPIPVSPVPLLEDGGDSWGIDLSESSSSLSDEEPRIKPPAPLYPPPVIKRMIPVDTSVERNYESSSNSSSSDEDEEEMEHNENHRSSINVVDFAFAQPTSFIHHNSNTGSSTVTIGAPHSQRKNSSGNNLNEVDPEMVKIFNNITVSNASRDFFALDLDNKANGAAENGARNGNGRALEDELYESTLNFDLESPDGGVGVINFQSSPSSIPLSSANNNTKSTATAAASDLELGVSRTLIISNSTTNNNDIQLAMDSIPNLQPPQ